MQLETTSQGINNVVHNNRNADTQDIWPEGQELLKRGRERAVVIWSQDLSRSEKENWQELKVSCIRAFPSETGVM